MKKMDPASRRMLIIAALVIGGLFCLTGVLLFVEPGEPHNKILATRSASGREALRIDMSDFEEKAIQEYSDNDWARARARPEGKKYYELEKTSPALINRISADKDEVCSGEALVVLVETTNALPKIRVRVN